LRQGSATRQEGIVPENAIPFKHLIPLVEIMADVWSTGVNTVKINKLYNKVIDKGITEMDIILNFEEQELRHILPAGIVNGIMHVRNGAVNVTPGYDGVYGRISIPMDTARKIQPSLF